MVPVEWEVPEEQEVPAVSEEQEVPAVPEEQGVSEVPEEQGVPLAVPEVPVVVLVLFVLEPPWEWKEMALCLIYES